MHDFVLFMVNTGLRPDEAWRLEFRDVEIVRNTGPKETILEISVCGERGVGYCKSMPGAVLPFEQLRDQLRPSNAEGRRQCHPGEGAEVESVLESKPRSTERLFPHGHLELLNKVLDDLSIKMDREGNARAAYSLRHTYISMRLVEGANIYEVAKNCRTRVEMIEKFYAMQIRHIVDTSVRREGPSSLLWRADAQG